MPTFNRWQIEWRNSGAGAGNPAFTRFDLGPTGLTLFEELAAVIAYCVGPGDSAVNTTIAGATLQVNGVGSLIPTAFPAAAYATIRASDTFLPAMAAYNVAFGSGALTVAGSSATVSPYSLASLGRRGQGRHYRPFMSAAVVAGAGDLAALNAAGIEEAYAATFLGRPGATWVLPINLNPQVVNASATTANPILDVLVSNQIANLHSRRK